MFDLLTVTLRHIGAGDGLGCGDGVTPGVGVTAGVGVTPGVGVTRGEAGGVAEGCGDPPPPLQPEEMIWKEPQSWRFFHPPTHTSSTCPHPLALA